MRTSIKTKEQLFERIYPEPNTGCWIWIGKQTYQGYGQLHKKNNNGFLLAHRYSYFLHNGPFELSKLVLHHCDNSFCVNPDHLYLGDIQQNVRDRERRGRRKAPRGELNSRAKLNWVAVGIIREALKEGFTTIEIARYFKMSQAVIAAIKLNWSWTIVQ